MADDDMRQIWRSVQAYPDFEVSSEGVVRRKTAHHRTPHALPAGSIVPQWEIRRPYKRKNGTTLRKRYLCVSLSRRVDGRLRAENVLVSRLVCEAFHGAPPSKRHQAAHCNGQSLDNRSDNLRWATPEANQADRNEHGTDIRGSKHHAAKLRESDVVSIIGELAAGKSDPEVATQFGLATVTVLGIRRGNSWRHVPRPDGFEATFNRSAAITREQAETIIDMLNRGQTHAEITEATGISASPIKRVKAGQLFPDLPRNFVRRASPSAARS